MNFRIFIVKLNSYLFLVFDKLFVVILQNLTIEKRLESHFNAYYQKKVLCDKCIIIFMFENFALYISLVKSFQWEIW